MKEAVVGKRAWLCILGIVVASLAGCDYAVDRVLVGDTRWILEAPDSFEFMTVDPSPEKFDPRVPGTMHGFPILGSKLIADPATQKKLTEAIMDAIRNNDGMVAGCFDPRHAIRVTRGKSTADILICFECRVIQVYQGGMQRGGKVSARSKELFERTAEQLGLPTATRPGQ